MKLLASLVILIVFAGQTLSATIAPKTSLYVPVSWRVQMPDDVFMDAIQIRSALKKAGKDDSGIPDCFIQNTGDDADRIYSERTAMEERLSKAFKGIKDLEDGDVWAGYFPTYGDSKKIKTCYVGDATGVADVISSLGDALWTEQTTLLGWKYKSEKHVDCSGEEEECDQWLAEESSKWAAFKGTNDDVLLLYSTGDDGTDVNEALVAPCKNYQP